MKCPSSDQLAAWLDRELPERRASEVAGHVSTCTVCTATVQHLERVIADLRSPVRSGPATETHVARVMARLDERPRPRRVWIGSLAVAVAAAAAIAVVWSIQREPTGPGGTFEPRGGGSGRRLDRDVGATVYTLASKTEPLASNARVTPDTAYVIGYRDLPSAPPVWTLAFAIDTRGDVHWLYPAYASRTDDPAAPALTPATSEVLMPDAAVLDHPAPGPLRIVVMIVPQRVHVSAIESLHGDELALPSLHARFPAAAISELRVVVQ